MAPSLDAVLALFDPEISLPVPAGEVPVVIHEAVSGPDFVYVLQTSAGYVTLSGQLNETSSGVTTRRADTLAAALDALLEHDRALLDIA